MGGGVQWMCLWLENNNIDWREWGDVGEELDQGEAESFGSSWEETAACQVVHWPEQLSVLGNLLPHKHWTYEII